MLKKLSIWVFAFSLFALLFTNKTFAGGGPVEFNIEPNTSLNPGEQYVVHARVYADGPFPTYCKNCFIRLGFVNPQESDYIAQNSEKTDNDGRIYAKVISKITGKRTIVAKELARPDGTEITSNSSVVLNYTGDTITPYPSIKVQEFNLKLVDQKYIDGPKRYVYLKWNKIDGAVKYNVYVRLTDGYYSSAVDATESTTSKVGINAFLDFYAKVAACFDADNCINSPEIFIPKMEKEDISITPEPTVEVSPTIITPKADKKVEELDKKVAELEKKLEASKKKQAQLENRVNDLLDWIKSLLPFFK